MRIAASIARTASAFVDFQQTWSLAEAKRLHDELAWFWAEFNCDLRDGGSSDVPTRPFASSVPANAETAASWTRWHRADFHALVDELAGPAESRSTALAALAAEAEQVFDDVVDAASLADAQEDLAAIVEAICLELASPSGSRADIEGASAKDGSARLVVPAAVDRGFLYLRTKPAD